MIVLYIVVSLGACALVGKLLTRSRDTNNERFGHGTTSSWGPDPVENPRMVDDGTDFGYKEFD
jgi:hypothetical protein